MDEKEGFGVIGILFNGVFVVERCCIVFTEFVVADDDNVFGKICKLPVVVVVGFVGVVVEVFTCKKYYKI